MALKLDVPLPPQLERAALKMEDLPGKVARFIEQQLAFEQSRAKQYSAEARSIAAEAMDQADQMREQGFERKQAGDDLLTVFDSLPPRKEPS